MGFWEWLVGIEAEKKDKRKKMFISFAIEDVVYRDYLIKQARKDRSPFDFIDMSVKKKWKEAEWRKKCRTKIRRCDGAIALLSKNTYKAGGAKWEMQCACEEGIKIIGMHIKRNNKGAIPQELKGKKIVEWSWPNIEKFVNSL
jgi:hypothetical protein